MHAKTHGRIKDVQEKSIKLKGLRKEVRRDTVFYLLFHLVFQKEPLVMFHDTTYCLTLIETERIRQYALSPDPFGGEPEQLCSGLSTNIEVINKVQKFLIFVTKKIGTDNNILLARYSNIESSQMFSLVYIITDFCYVSYAFSYIQEGQSLNLNL